jgi:hypothetical protein
MRSSSQRLSCSWQEVETTPSAATLGVVDTAPHVRLSNKLDGIRSSGSNLLGKNAIIIATTVNAYGKKSIHIKHERGYSLRILTENLHSGFYGT